MEEHNVPTDRGRIYLEVEGETFAALAPDCRALHVFERSAHRPWAEQPDEYFDTVKGFLAGR